MTDYLNSQITAQPSPITPASHVHTTAAVQAGPPTPPTPATSFVLPMPLIIGRHWFAVKGIGCSGTTEARYGF